VRMQVALFGTAYDTMSPNSNSNQPSRNRSVFGAVVVVLSILTVSYIGIVTGSNLLILAGIASTCLSTVWVLGWLRGGARSARAWLVAGAVYIAFMVLKTYLAFSPH